MESDSPSPNPHPQNPMITVKPSSNNRDFLTRLEIYLAKRDGVDKLLKISRYATQIILASSILTQQPLVTRLKAFESNVGISRKAFRLGKFVQDVNALRSTRFTTRLNVILSVIAYGGEGLYYFIEQFVWLGKAGLIDKRHLPSLQKWSAWFEFVGYFGSISLKVRELRTLDAEEKCLVASTDLAMLRGFAGEEAQEKLRKLREKKLMKRLSVVQDLADGLMSLADIRDGRGRLSSPLLVSAAGLLSALLSSHKNWVSC